MQHEAAACRPRNNGTAVSCRQGCACGTAVSCGQGCACAPIEAAACRPRNAARCRILQSRPLCFDQIASVLITSPLQPAHRDGSPAYPGWWWGVDDRGGRMMATAHRHVRGPAPVAAPEPAAVRPAVPAPAPRQPRPVGTALPAHVRISLALSELGNRLEHKSTLTRIDGDW